jgi:hemerythrin-like domain-containing protein
MDTAERLDPHRRPISRRVLLATGAAALAVGAAATEVANLASAGPTATTTVPPDVDLMEEHGILKRVLLAYQAALARMSAGGVPPAAAIHDSALIIHDFIEGFHEPLEEGYVFPALRQAGIEISTIDTLLIQHARGRERTQIILSGATPATLATRAAAAKVTEAMQLFIRMYEPHEAREDTVVFPSWRALLSAGQLEEMAGRFADLQDRQFGADAFTVMVRRVETIERTLGIYDLAQFTPPTTAG